MTDFTGNDFSEATGSATVSGSASRNKESADLGSFIPFASGDADFQAAVAVSEPTEVSISFSANGSNDDKDECTQVDASIQADDQSFNSTRDFGVSCAGHSGPDSFSGVITSGASIDVSIGATVDPEKPDSSNHYSGSFSASLSVAGTCSSSGAIPAGHHGIQLVDGGVHAQGNQCPTGAPLTGDILFDATPGSESLNDLFVLDARGIDPAESLDLTATPSVSESDPAWSPDGKGVAFDDGLQIFTMTAGGSEIHQLTTGNGPNTEPAWSPDGTKIAFVSSRTGHREIWVMDQDGDNQTQMTNLPKVSKSPAWSPDGHTIAFASNALGINGSDFDIWSMPATPFANPSQLTGNDPMTDENPTFAPNGSILFDTNRAPDNNFQIYSMGANGSNQNPINATNDNATDVDPTVSPDGNFVAFTGSQSGPGLYVMPIQGGTATQFALGGGIDPNWGQSACTYYGTEGPDTFTGDGRLRGGPGDDHLTGGVENDTIDGGPGDDTLKDSAGTNFIFGGDGADEIVGGKGKDVILGGPGDDAIFGNGGNDRIQGEDGNDNINGNAGDDRIDGGAGHDALFGSAGADTIIDGPDGDTPGSGIPGTGVFGGSGADTINACNGVKDTIDGELGTDTAKIDKGTDVTTHVEVKHFC